MLIVQKYGGTSVGSVDRIRNVAARALATQRAGHDVVLIVSAMSGETNRLLALAKEVSGATLPEQRELDVVASTGEQVTVGLCALAIQSLGGKAISFLGHQVRVLTDSAFTRARIQSIDGTKIREALSQGRIAVIAGFQGQDEAGNITTLGRGGSDTSGVAIAAALQSSGSKDVVCEIYTDVDGVYTTDPNICPSARKIDRISFEEMLELASLGAKVLQIRSVEMAMNHNVRVHVRSSFHDREGTWVVPEEKSMEQVVVTGVAADKNESKVTVVGVPDEPGIAAKLFRPLGDSGIIVDMIIQNVSSEGRTDLTFTVPRTDLQRARDLMGTIVDARTIRADEKIAKISVVGVGMRSHAGVAQRMFEILAREGINIQMISTSEIKISVVVDEKYAELAVRVLHDGFELHRP